MNQDPFDVLADQERALLRLNELDREYRAQHREACGRRARILDAPEPAEDLVKGLGDLVDASAARFAQEIGSNVIRSLSRGLDARADGSLRQTRAKLPSFPNGDQLTFRDLCGLAPALVKQRLAEIVRETAANGGIPIAQRQTLLAEVEREIEEIEAAHTAFVDRAGSLTPPIIFALLPPVAARREEEAARRRRAAEELEARRLSEAEINDQARARVGHSRYVATGRF